MGGPYQGTRKGLEGLRFFGGFLLVGKRVDLLDPTTAALGSRCGDQLRTPMYPTAYPGPPISGSGRVFGLWWRKVPGYHRADIEKKKEEKKLTFLFLPRFKIPLFTLGRVYKYSPRKEEMTCLCNVPSDLASAVLRNRKEQKKEKKEEKRGGA